MIEKDFKDRISTHPGRIRLVPVEGQQNTFDLSKADEPTEPGTALNREAFNSIIHSRLTGRFYAPAATRTADTSRTNLTVSPIPTSGWIYDTDNRLIARSGVFMVEGNSDLNTSANRVDDVFNSDGWESQGGLESIISVYCVQALHVKKIRFKVGLQYSSRLLQMEIQASVNGSTWQALGTYSNSDVTTDVLMDYELVNTGDFNYYRIVFTSDRSNRIMVSELSYILYDISSYINNYSLENMPLEWTTGQRLMILTPSNVNTFAVAENYLNDTKINTILQSGKRYELRYNGTAFDAKEV